MTEFGSCGRLSSEYEHTDGEFDSIKSRLSIEYIGVLCSYLDLEYSEPKPTNDRSGFDLQITPVTVKDEWIVKPILHVQVKSTSVPVIKDGFLHFSLNTNTYKQLSKKCMKDCSILCVLCLTDDTSRWVENDQNQLTMRKTMYWCKPSEYENIDLEKKSVTLRIPTVNIFDKRTLHMMIDKLSRREVFTNEL